ncbi:MAG: rhodanese-like domain-containing protein [Microscillaceae bacterium]|nr:rhodanese-like domain-containing protein [Microscillaceae bacterium]MDW8460068.1 rhodanese-like domain-containing protein [Cytophagales bacterium]
MFNLLKKLFGGSNERLRQVLAEGAFLVDVRTPSEFKAGSVKGAVNIPLDTISSNLSKFKSKQHIVVFCQSGIRSSQAKAILEKNGFENIINGGSWYNVAKLVK